MHYPAGDGGQAEERALRLIITGAASGIGRATALEFARRPMDGMPAAMLLVDRDEDNLRIAAQEVGAEGAKAEFLTADLSGKNFAAQIVATAVASFGGLDTIVSNAGAIHSTPLVQLSADQFDTMMAVNARATLLLGQAAHPHLKSSGGSIVATASTAADHPAIPLGAYSTSKIALVMLIRQMAAEWGPDGIRANCVSPGPTHTAMTKAAYDDPGARARRGAEIPLGRVGRPEDLARAIYFLAGPDAAFISGVNLHVDGGLSAALNRSQNSAANRI